MQKKKFHKYTLSKFSFYIHKKYSLIFGNYGIISLCLGLITPRHLEKLRRKLSKQFKRLNKINKSKLFIRVNIWLGYTEKPMLSRMGKGAGTIKEWKSFIRPGFILIEILTTELSFNVDKIVKNSIKYFPLKLLLIKKRS